MFIEKKLVIKICGITNIQDAECAIKYGADAIGFIFAKSPRQIDINKAKNIASKLDNDVLKVGVVVDKYINQVVKGVKDGWLDAVQFHGDTDNDTAESFNVCWYKVIRVKEKEDFSKAYYSPMLLYDAFSKEAYGGTGKQIDSDLLEYAKSKDIDLYLAGGINPDNVKSIIKKYNPLLLDIATGLEKSPGIKDHEKIKKLFDELREVKR
jgi:phosphoribosylanthranilate isomerase